MNIEHTWSETYRGRELIKIENSRGIKSCIWYESSGGWDGYSLWVYGDMVYGMMFFTIYYLAMVGELPRINFVKSSVEL